MEGTPPGDALLPPPRRATPARKGARCGASAGSPRPHRPHPGHTGRGTLTARSRGRTAGGGTASDTRRPSQRWKAPPPRGRPSATPTASNAGPQGRTLWGRCWVHTPASTAPGTHGSRNPGRPEDGRPGEGQRLTPDAPRNAGKRLPGDAHPPPPHRATHQRTNAPATGHPHPTPCS